MLCDYNDQMCVHTCFRNSIGVTRIQDCIGIALTIISLVFEASINTINISFVFFFILCAYAHSDDLGDSFPTTP